LSRNHAYIEPTSLAHLEKIRPIEQVKMRLDTVRENMALVKNQMHYFTIISSAGKVLGITGADIIEEGTWEFWSIPDQQVVDHFISYSRAAKEFFDLVCSEKDVKRAQAWIDTRFTWAAAWAKFLGMAPEGAPVPLGEEGKTYMMFAKVSA
jgi:hypothetical protein